MKVLNPRDVHIAVVVPAYHVAHEIQHVVQAMPSYVRTIIVVNDGSPDDTDRVVLSLSREEPRLVYLRHQVNAGVGRAVSTGYAKALQFNADIVVKMDGDGQMEPKYLPRLIAPLIRGEADYTKGNRFYHADDLRQMPYGRLLGNGVLGFLVRLTSGYWNIYDPTNGYTAIRAEVLKQLRLDQLHHGYFFETSMLINLYLLRAKVMDIPIPAKYGGEVSSLNMGQVMVRFPGLLMKGFLKRLWLRHLLFELSVCGLFFILGGLLFGFGVVFGSLEWLKSMHTGKVASAGTVMLAALPLTLGFILLVQAVALDINSVPVVPLVQNRLQDIDEYELE
jgi:glycosyltransferase involved in cell wall biosynthesis